MSRPDAPAVGAAPPRSATVGAARTRGAAPVLAPLDAPARPTLIAVAVYAVATLLLAWPALLGRFLVNSLSDQYIAGYAFREFQASFIREFGRFPLWNPYQFGGMPYVAAFHGDEFYPTAWLRLLMPTDAGMTWGMIAHVFLAGFFTYRFLRALGVRYHASVLAGLLYMLGGNVAGLVSPGHDGKLYLCALLPAALLCVHRAVREGRLWAWGALAITITLAVLTPHPQLLQYLLLVTGAYALFCAFAADADGVALARPVAIRRLALAAGAVVLGMLGGAIQYWPLFEYTPWSPRAGGKGWEHAVSFSMPPEELFNSYLPQFSGILEGYWGRNNIHFHSDYLGVVALVLAGLGLGSALVPRRARWFWIGTLIVATLWAMGGFTPFYHLIYALVPGTKYFRAPSTMLFVVQFAAAVLAGFGADRALAGQVRLRYLIGWLGFAAVVALLATGGLLTNVAMGLAGPERAVVADAGKGALLVGAWRSLLVVAACVGVLVALLRGRLRPAAAAWALVAIGAVDLWSIERLYWRFSPPAAQLYAGDKVIDYLRVQSDSGRVVPLAAEQLVPSAYRDPYLSSGYGNGGGMMVHGIRSVVGYHGNELDRYIRLSGVPEPDYPSDWPRQLGNPNFWRLLNVRFLYTNTPQAPIEGATLVAGPVRNVAGNTIYLYRLPNDNPPAWVTPIAVKAPDANVLATVLDPRFDVGRAALFDTAAAVPTQAVPPQLPAPLDLKARITRRIPDRISIALDRPAPAGAALVVSENYYPGWTATVDGKPAPVGRADYVLIGVPLAAGARTIELAFTSARYEAGKLVSLAVVALSGLVIVAGALAERRRRA